MHLFSLFSLYSCFISLVGNCTSVSTMVSIRTSLQEAVSLGTISWTPRWDNHVV